ncbi:hypothetical protein C8F01DRAFT_195798 [Mycena amicta]|nr:hypothetical protein C8F01DRAFT_195798 [Mycena amicta]
MHRALTISELIDLILNELLVGDWFSGPMAFRGTISSLAQTCKSLKEPALDCLWRTQKTMDHLIKCLPSDSWEVRRGKYSSSMCLIKEVPSIQWQRARTYARRVRVLELEWNTMPDSSVFEAIRTLLSTGSEPFFPRLQRIRSRLSIHYYPDILLVPTLTTVCIPVITEDSLVALSSSQLHFPALKELTVDSGMYRPRLSDHRHLASGFSSIARRLADVEYLHLPSINGEALVYVSRLPRLRSMSLHMKDTADFGPSFILPKHLPFPTLQFFSLYYTTIEFATQFVDMLEPGCTLSHLRIETGVPAPSKLLHHLYASIGKHISPGSLRSLYIGSLDNDDDPPTPAPHKSQIDDYLVNGAALAPLLQFMRLTKLTLQPAAGFVLDNATAEKIASAYPDLTTLKLNSGTQLRCTQPSLTLVALRAFVEHCPRLWRLDLELNARTVPPSGDAISDVDGSFSLRTQSIYLNVGFSPIRDPDAVAHFLFGLFPKIAGIRASDEWEMPFTDEEDDDDDDESLVWARRYHQKWSKAFGIVNRMAREADHPGLRNRRV